MPAATLASERARVLLVDDNADLLARAAAVLERGCTIVGAVSDGPSALAAAATLRPDVIVLDISMGGMTGLDVARRLRAAGSPAALVFLTVHQDAEIVSAAQSLGGGGFGFGYVIKRRLASDLVRAVRTALAGRPFVSSLTERPAARG